MTRKSKARYGLKRTYKLNPTVKALRNALVAGMMVASLAPSAVLASPPPTFIYKDIQDLGDINIDNVDDLTAIALNRAIDILGVSFDGGNVSIHNEGVLTAIADATTCYSEYGCNYDAMAAGIVASTTGDVSIWNSAAITATASAAADGYANAFGIYAVGAKIELTNSGDITTSASVVDAYNSGQAFAAGIVAIGEGKYGQVDITNTGNITASSSVSGEGEDLFSDASAFGIYAIALGEQGLVSINNTGDITLSATNDIYYGTATAVGINVISSNGAGIVNSGDIVITASSGGGNVYGFVQDPSYTLCGYYNCYISYAGTIDTAGIRSESLTGVTTVTNSGDITITDLNPDGGFLGNLDSGDYLKGIDAFNNMGEVVVNNSGDIVLEGGKWDFGILAQTGSTFGLKNTYVEYYCSPFFGCYGGYYADLPYNFGGGDVTVVNSGNITITTEATHPLGWLNYRASIGIVATTDLCGSAYPWLDDSSCGGDVSVVNSGELNITNTGSGGAEGIDAYTGFISGGNVYVGNSGDINIFGTEFATGIHAKATTGNAYVKNLGNITTQTDSLLEDGRAVGIDACSAAGTTTVLNSGDIVSNGDIAGGGIRASGRGGDVNVVNTGDVTANSSTYQVFYSYYRGGYYALGGNSFGIRANTAYAGNSSVKNSGDLEVYGVINAYGIITNAKDSSAYTLNTGNIHVSNSDSVYAGNVYGIINQASGFAQYIYGEAAGYSTVINTGDITANSTELAVGIKATSIYGGIDIQNSGTIVVDSVNRAARGIQTTNAYGTTNILNTGDMTITGPGSAVAIAALSSGYGIENYYGDIAIANGGDLTATSEYSRATAIEAQSTYGSIDVLAYGHITATAYTRAFGIDARTIYGGITVENHAEITADGETEFATGIRAQTNYGDISISNAGDVSASAYSLAQGIAALSYYGTASIDNSGDVTASSSDGYSQVVALRSYYGSTLNNSGNITAATGDYAMAVSITGGAGEINNTGSIAGSILTDAGDDVINNTDGGLIALTNDVIDLGAGDDVIYNGEDSTISMLNSSIVFGEGYNSFYNHGELVVNGLNNTINMGGGVSTFSYSEYGSNSSTFYNYGNSIHMNDGATNDALTIIGNFAGDGSIFVDVDGLSMSSDHLTIDGDVVAGTENVVDVNLLTLPSAADILDGETISMVTVTGANAAGDFVLGDVHLVNGALFTADYELVREPGTDFSLGFEVTGLSTQGVLYSTVAPAMQNLWFSSLGTMYQRQGGERNFTEDGSAEAKGAAGVWARMYGSDGSLSPDAKRSNFGSGGSQDFSVSTSGIEAGFGYSFNSQWTVGLFGGFNDGSFKPDVGGKATLDGNTWGGYVTFTPGNGFYADLSYRDISYDGDVLNAGVKENLDGSASGYSLEMGYGFKLESGLEVEPQLQYSDVNVDVNKFAYSSGGYELTDGDASQLRVGVAARKSFTQDSGVWTPYAALSYVENYSGSNRYLIGGVLDGQVDLSGGSMLLELGTDARYGHFMVNAGVGWQDGGAYDSVLTGQVNVRYSW